jgi:hypothetical protein
LQGRTELLIRDRRCRERVAIRTQLVRFHPQPQLRLRDPELGEAYRPGLHVCVFRGRLFHIYIFSSFSNS